MRTSRAYCRGAGIFIMMASFFVLASQFGLMKLFDFPNIFSAPIGTILMRYHEGGALLTLAWFCFALGSLMIVPMALLLHQIIRRDDTPLLAIGTTFGILAGICYVIGIMRWVLLARVLSTCYVDPTTTTSAQETIVLLFKAFDVYCGNTFGETIAPIAHAGWLVLLGHAMLKSPVWGRWMAWLQMFFGIVILLRPLEYAGWRAAAEISDMGLGIWVFSLILMSVPLIQCKTDPA